MYISPTQSSLMERRVILGSVCMYCWLHVCSQVPNLEEFLFVRVCAFTTVSQWSSGLAPRCVEIVMEARLLGGGGGLMKKQTNANQR